MINLVIGFEYFLTRGKMKKENERFTSNIHPRTSRKAEIVHQLVII